ncbi:uncharacterized protein CC84DRAFT_865611 [Paraphaeosphaeria sporulosa]|uniref:Uncharacterized protein n=1 Tax=Paraphaeosphaeria sporulosa TaxID=1460663 RepID=A0A177CA71_9PLEO|nr:uncharacterized protein CC84DRAFT_865611 [Paraphaeosphaeria sporulosa]OAG03742.1 hypothetical protein CC84DRAFT_865611 [Paraphaeosphaeria sporulosa]
MKREGPVLARGNGSAHAMARALARRGEHRCLFLSQLGPSQTNNFNFCITRQAFLPLVMVMMPGSPDSCRDTPFMFYIQPKVQLWLQKVQNDKKPVEHGVVASLTSYNTGGCKCKPQVWPDCPRCCSATLDLIFARRPFLPVAYVLSSQAGV